MDSILATATNKSQHTQSREHHRVGFRLGHWMCKRKACCKLVGIDDAGGSLVEVHQGQFHCVGMQREQVRHFIRG